MSYCKKLWNILFLSYLILINLWLTYHVIFNSLEIKSNKVDPLKNVSRKSDPLDDSNWRNRLTLLILDCIIISLVLLPFILYTNILPVGNLANDGRLLGKEELFYFDLNETGKAKILLNSKEKPCCKQNILRLLLMEMPPISYVLQVVAAYCYLIPKPFLDARHTCYDIPKANLIWHTDLDILFGPKSSNTQLMTVAYFNFGFSLFLLSVHYSRVFRTVSRAFALALFSIMLTFSIHMLVEYCLLSVMIQIAENPKMDSFSMRLDLNIFTIICLPILANIILLFSFTTVFHYGILQYGDAVVHRNRIIRRQPHIVCSNPFDMEGPLHPSTSENRYLESSIEPVFSKSHLPHILAICSIVASVIFKTPVVFSSIKHLYFSTASTLAVVNMFISFFYLVSWLILWFAFALRRTWNFKVETNANSNTDQILLNGNMLLNDDSLLQLDELPNSFLLRPQTSQSNLPKQNMMTIDRRSNNCLVLQPLRNENVGFDVNNHRSVWRNPMYLSCPVSNPNTQNPNTIYAYDDHVNIRSTHLEDQLSSEHSYKSNWSRNPGFELLPPILPIFDENRYKQFNQNSAPIEKRVARYTRNSIFDINEPMQLSILNNDLVNYTPTRTDMTYSLDNNLQRNNNRFKQSNLWSSQLRSPEKYCSLHGNAKGGFEQMDFLYGDSDDDLQRSGSVSGDTSSSDEISVIEIV